MGLKVSKTGVNYNQSNYLSTHLQLSKYKIPNQERYIFSSDPIHQN